MVQCLGGSLFSGHSATECI